ncbi:MAG: hypothetical protein KC897_04100 [Candidatus Omnitrophica bacterium]|nr:hypothetical protein [Candidatus Omnitrophota bacterium]MCB9719346.1 hypothetical protein [Candidatus Omnitrophota bacterium]
MARTTMTSANYTMRNLGHRGNAGLFGQATVEKNLMIRKKWQDGMGRTAKGFQIRK